MYTTTDPNVPTEVEIKRLWHEANRSYDPSLDDFTQFFEKVFQCDRLTAQSVASCVLGGSRAGNSVVNELEDLREDVPHAIDEAIGRVRKLV